MCENCQSHSLPSLIFFSLWVPFSRPLPALTSIPLRPAGPPSRCFVSFRMSRSSPPGGANCAESPLSHWLLYAWMAWYTGPPSALPTVQSCSRHHHHHYRRHRLAEELEGLQGAGERGRQGAATRMTSCWRLSIRNSRGLTYTSSCRTRKRGRRRGFLGNLLGIFSPAATRQLTESPLSHSVTTESLLSHRVITMPLLSHHRLTAESP